MVFCPRGKKDDQNLELAMVFCPRGKKTRFTPYNQGVKLLIIQGVSKWLGINFRMNSLRKMWHWRPKCFAFDCSSIYNLNNNIVNILKDKDANIYRVIHVRWRAWPGTNRTENTLYKAFIVFWYLKIKSGIQVGILLIWKVYLSFHFSFIFRIWKGFRTMTEPIWSYLLLLWF
jgi:hypothetical protein